MTIPIRYTTSNAPWMPHIDVYHAECLSVLRGLPSDSVSVVITDPPYGLSDHSPAEVVQAITAWASGDRERVPDGRGFMGNEWDRFVPPPAVWDECFRVLKPGGYMAVFAGSRTADLMGLSIRLAGFEMRDTITWMYGNGFPKSLDISKAINKAAGAQRVVIGTHYRHGGGTPNSHSMSGPLGTDGELPLTAPATDAAKQWNGWGTALKPASEPIIVARKPIMGTVAANVLVHGTGGLNIDACRVQTANNTDRATYEAKCASVVGLDSNRNGATYGEWAGVREDSSSSLGRWPANVVISHDPDCEDQCVESCPVLGLDQQSGTLTSGKCPNGFSGPYKAEIYNKYARNEIRPETIYGDSGGASRFFNVFRYQAKAPKSERPVINGVAHPTVKPLALMEWLVTLFTPPGGLIIDPFGGTGTTGLAGLRKGFSSIVIERDLKYQPHIDKKLNDYLQSLPKIPISNLPWIKAS